MRPEVPKEAQVQNRSATLINGLGGRDAVASEPLDREVKVAWNATKASASASTPTSAPGGTLHRTLRCQRARKKRFGDVSDAALSPTRSRSSCALLLSRTANDSVTGRPIWSSAPVCSRPASLAPSPNHRRYSSTIPQSPPTGVGAAVAGAAIARSGRGQLRPGLA